MVAGQPSNLPHAASDGFRLPFLSRCVSHKWYSSRIHYSITTSTAVEQAFLQGRQLLHFTRNQLSPSSIDVIYSLWTTYLLLLQTANASARGWKAKMAMEIHSLQRLKLSVHELHSCNAGVPAVFCSTAVFGIHHQIDRSVCTRTRLGYGVQGCGYGDHFWAHGVTCAEP